MSADYSNIQPQPQPRKGLAIASLVLGIISIPTLGLLVVGAITAIALGAIAIGRIKKEPAIYGGKGMAIGGIITSAVSLLLTAVFVMGSAIVIPKMIDSLRSGRETATLNSLRIIHKNQAQYSVMRGRFGDLKELAEAGLLDRSYANGEVISGYVYSSSSVSNETFCIHAVRARNSVASRDFVICEDGIIRFVESKTPGLVKRGEGDALDSSFYSR
ncbi:MAG TPA: DUF4190 domain-containing protein [Blastocatellia bacterium]|nr:DUF4190 domain-containing protein [Blastocatellia bacterium]